MLARTRLFTMAALASAVALAGCSGKTAGPASTPGAGAAPDRTTLQAAQQSILADPSLAGARIRVAAQMGTISLDGTVRSLAQKDRAERIVLHIQGEKHQQQGVYNNLSVGGAGSTAGESRDRH